MGSKRNPTYFDGDLVRCVKDEALRVIDEAGPGAVSLRAIARSIGVSHNAPMKHFADKSELFAALAIEGFELIDARFAEVSARRGPTDSPIERTVRSSKGFVEWAETHRAYYLVMWQPDLYRRAASVLSAQQRPFERWVNLLAEAHTEGLGAAMPLTTLVEVLWAVVTGLAAQVVNGMNPTGSDHTGVVVETVTQALSRAA